MVGYLLTTLWWLSQFCLILSQLETRDFFRSKLYRHLYLDRGRPKATRIPTSHPTAELGDLLYHDFLIENWDTLENYFEKLLRRASSTEKIQKGRAEPSSAFIRSRSSPQLYRDRFLKKFFIFEKFVSKVSKKNETVETKLRQMRHRLRHEVRQNEDSSKFQKITFRKPQKASTARPVHHPVRTQPQRTHRTTLRHLASDF